MAAYKPFGVCTTFPCLNLYFWYPGYLTNWKLLGRLVGEVLTFAESFYSFAFSVIDKCTAGTVRSPEALELLEPLLGILVVSSTMQN